VPIGSENFGNRPLAGARINHAHPLSQGLVGCWPLTETAGSGAYDASRKGNGSLVGFSSSPWNTTNQQASSFRSASGPRTPLKFPLLTTEYVDIPSSPLYDGPVGAIALWMRTRQGFSSVNVAMVARHDAASSANGLTFYLTPNLTAQFKTTAGTIRLTLSEGTDMDDDREHLVGVNFSQASGGACTLWRDGRLIASGVTTGAWAFNSQNIRLGTGHDAFWNQYGGGMGIFRWYNRHLAAHEWMQLYTNPYGGFMNINFSGAIFVGGGGGGIGGSGSIFKSPVFNSRVVRGRGLTH